MILAVRRPSVRTLLLLLLLLLLQPWVLLLLQPWVLLPPAVVSALHPEATTVVMRRRGGAKECEDAAGARSVKIHLPRRLQLAAQLHQSQTHGLALCTQIARR